MRNFIKYPPIEWRKRHEDCLPQGPCFSSASRSSLLLAGSEVCLTVPRHSPRRSVVKQENVPKWQDVLLDNELIHYPRGVMANDFWGSVGLMGRVWAFYGPWMSGCKGELSLSVSVNGRLRGHEIEGLSFFNPKAFEVVLVQYLNDRYGHKNWGGGSAHIPRYHGPVGWECHHYLPVPSASFKIYKRGEDVADLGLPDHLFVFPVTDKHFVEVCFVQEYYSRKKTGAVAFDTTPFQELQNNILNSIRLQLSPKVQADLDKIKAEVGNMQMCKDFAPLKWPTNVYPPAPSGQMPEQPSLQAGN